MIIRSKNPQVIEYPFGEACQTITPTEKFYVRDHFPQPELKREDWRLNVAGVVDNPLQLSYDDILSMPSRDVVATLECAGNGRSFLVPKGHGVQWDLGGVGTAKWTGVPVSVVLEKAGIRHGARDIVFEGADSGLVEVDGGRKVTEAISFSRSLPLAKASDPDVLLAYRMNDQDLTKAHGFPLRLIVPGWYAVASIKWLTSIIVSDQQFNGFWQTMDYAYWDRSGETPVRVPITRLSVKSEIAKPEVGERVSVNSEYEVRGACWAGESAVERVEVSTDNGANWQPAELLGDPVRNAWRLWRFNWRTPDAPGRTVLLSRALDSDGRTQGTQHNPDHGDYLINHCLPVQVELV